MDLSHAASGICWVEASGRRPEPGKGARSGKDGRDEKDGKDGSDPSARMARSKYAGYGFENMPEVSHDRDHSKSELLRKIMEIMEERGNPVDLKTAFSIQSSLDKAGFIVYEKPFWRGVCYDPSFA